MKIFWEQDNLNSLWKMPNASSMVYFNKQYLRSCDVPGFPPFDIPFPKDHVNFPRTISYIFFTLTTVYIMQ